MNRRRLKKLYDTLRQLCPAVPAGGKNEARRQTEKAADEPAEEIARDFLDRRDEARISHRLGRPFRF